VVMAGQGMRGRIVWHKDHALGDLDAVVVPGGFSYGDYLRAGAMAAHSPVMAAVKDFARAGGPVLGICNGFQILCEAGLLEGALARNASLKFVCKDVHLVVEGRPTPFTHAIPAGRHLRMPIAHAEGRYSHPDIERLEKDGQVVFRYADAEGAITDAANPNGSLHNIAGVCNAAGNVVGLMPHPERACEAALGGEDGCMLFESLLSWKTGSPARVGGTR
jgi:phosphoribosylformylglycinamidine synthase I